jgi:hypothetical protein
MRLYGIQTMPANNLINMTATIGLAMPDTDALTPPDPVVRFRIRSLIGVTTGLACLAAVAGPYLRSQPVEVQTALIIYWCMVTVCSMVGLWRAWRGLWTCRAGDAPVDFVLWLAPRRFWAPTFTWLNRGFQILCCIVWLTFHSKLVAERVRSGSWSTPWLAWLSLIDGMLIGCWLLVFLRKPVRLTAAGVLMGKQRIPWIYIRTAEWAYSRPGVLRLHRLDGDIYAAVSEESHAAVEEYVRRRTHFISVRLRPAS